MKCGYVGFNFLVYIFLFLVGRFIIRFIVKIGNIEIKVSDFVWRYYIIYYFFDYIFLIRILSLALLNMIFLYNNLVV